MFPEYLKKSSQNTQKYHLLIRNFKMHQKIREHFKIKANRKILKLIQQSQTHSQAEWRSAPNFS
jgi:hypothetical protein